MSALVVAIALSASAQPPNTVELDFHVDGPVDPDIYDELIEAHASSVPGARVRLYGIDDTGERAPLWHFVPQPGPLQHVKRGERRPMSTPVDHPGETPGALSGRAVYLSQCHGWIWYDSLNGFSTQRGNNWDTVEDFHNPEGMNQYLAAYLENAGAGVYTVKERDKNTDIAYADNDGAGYSEKGAGFENGGDGFADAAPYAYGENPFESGTTRRFPANGGGVATFIPEVPADNYYAVYVAWENDSDNATDAHYRIHHPGGVIDRYVDQSVHGSTWQYIETLWLSAGVGSLTIELVADSTSSGTWLSADAVRIGGGMGVIERNGEVTGEPRWEEGAILAAQFNGAPISVYDPYFDGDGSDPSSRSVWAAWEHPAGEDAVYLSWHSNAFDGTARGTITYHYDMSSCSSSPAIEGSDVLAEAVQDEIMDVILTEWDSDWQDRGVGDDCFSENNPSLNPEMPSALVELAFHDNELDASYLKDPRFRRDASRGMYRGIVRYFYERDGLTPTFLPEPPVEVQVTHGSDGLEVRWSPNPMVGAPYGDAPTSYRVFTSADGRSWDNGADVSDTAYTLPHGSGDTVFVRVAALNAGGISFPSTVVGGRLSPDGWAPVLVVHAFDRMDAGLLEWDNEPDAGIGDIVRMDLRRVNSFDAVAAHGRAIAAAGWYFDAISSDALDAVDLSSYSLVVWAAGEESTADETFDDAQQQALRTYTDGGGQLWTSGAEVLWDLDAQGDATDQAFAADVLGATMDADSAGTNQADGAGILAGVDLAFGATYPVEWPDVLDSAHDVIATYATGGIAAVHSPTGALFGFPFETIASESSQEALAAALLPTLVPDYVPPDPDSGTDPGDTGDDDDDDDDTGTPPDDYTPPGGDDIAAYGPGSRLLKGGLGCDATGGAPALVVTMMALTVITRRRRDTMGGRRRERHGLME